MQAFRTKKSASVGLFTTLMEKHLLEVGTKRYLERAKLSFLLCPIFLSCLVMNKICLNQKILIPPWQKKVMFLVELVCLSVCLFDCGQHYSKNYKRIMMKFCGGVLGGTIKNSLNLVVIWE